MPVNLKLLVKIVHICCYLYYARHRNKLNVFTFSLNTGHVLYAINGMINDLTFNTTAPLTSLNNAERGLFRLRRSCIPSAKHEAAVNEVHKH